MIARATEIPVIERAPGIPRPLTSVRRRTVMISKVGGCFGKLAGQILPTGDSAPVLRPVPVHLNSVNTGDQARDDGLRSASVNAAAWPTTSYRVPLASAATASTFPIHGEMTVRGVTRPASLACEVDGFARSR